MRSDGFCNHLEEELLFLKQSGDDWHPSHEDCHRKAERVRRELFSLIDFTLTHPSGTRSMVEQTKVLSAQRNQQA